MNFILGKSDLQKLNKKQCVQFEEGTNDELLLAALNGFQLRYADEEFNDNHQVSINTDGREDS